MCIVYSMPLSYEKNKTHIYKWRETNRAKLNEINVKSRMKKYYLERELKIFRRILLN